MKYIVLSFLVLCTLVTNAQHTISDPNAQVRKVGAFSGVSAASGIEVLIKQGNEDAVAVSSSDPKYTDKIKTEVSNGILKIYFDNKDWMNHRPSNLHLKAYVSAKSLNTINGSSGASVKTDGEVSSDNLSMEFSSGSLFDGKLRVKTLKIEQNSGSIMTAGGTIGDLSINTSSGAIYKGFSADAINCTAHASSGAMVEVAVNKSLSVHASSGGSVQYKGNATMSNVSTSSGGSVSRKS